MFILSITGQALASAKVPVLQQVVLSVCRLLPAVGCTLSVSAIVYCAEESSQHLLRCLLA